MNDADVLQRYYSAITKISSCDTSVDDSNSRSDDNDDDG